MDLEIRSEPFSRRLHGFSGRVVNHNYGQVGKGLMDAMWKEIREKGLKHRGINHWVYDAEDSLFVGVELEDEPEPGATNLEHWKVVAPKYAYHKHVGAYSQLPEIHADMHRELKARGIQAGWPALEIYGHWSMDESKLETEVLIAIVSGD